MGTIVCKDCQRVIDHIEVEKVTVIYSSQCSCHKH